MMGEITTEQLDDLQFGRQLHQRAEPEQNIRLSAQARRSLSRVDNMSPDLRACVHEYGEPIVSICLQMGIREPRRIRQLVNEIWNGARQPYQTRPTLGSLDWLLAQAGAAISAKTLLRILRDNNHYIVPMSPTREMIEASMAEVANFDLKITKKEKHARRLAAAIRAGVRHIWPDLV